MLKGWRPYLLIVLFGFLLYGQTLFFDFTYFDDQILVLENYSIISNPKNIGDIFLSDAFFSNAKYYYRPLLNLSLMLDANIGGVLPFIFYFFNIVWHLIATMLVFKLLKKINCQPALAWFFSLVFLVHPALTQAVAWIPGRNDSLLTVFVLAATLCFLSFKDEPRLRTYLGYLGFLLLALFTKETAAFLPPLIILYFLLVEPKKIETRDKWLLIIGSLAAGFIWLLFRHLALGTDPVTLNIVATTIFKNLPAILVVLGKTLIPVNLAVLPILADSTIIYGLLVVILLLTAFLFARPKNYRYLTWGLAWFILFLLPSFVRLNPIDTPDFLEHRLYLPLVGFLIVLAEIEWFKKLDFNKRGTKILATSLLIVLVILTWRHTLSFKDRNTFWQAAVKSSPHSPLAQRNLGVMYYLADDSEAAVKHYQAALALNPNEPMVHNNLGVIYLNDKRYSQAEKEFKKELSLNPNYDRALFNLGDLYYRQKDYRQAASFWQAALAVNPRYYEAYERLLILENQLR